MGSTSACSCRPSTSSRCSSARPLSQSTYTQRHGHRPHCEMHQSLWHTSVRTGFPPCCSDLRPMLLQHAACQQKTQGSGSHLRPHFQHLPAARHVQLRRLRCDTVVDGQHHALPVLCRAVPEVRADTEVVVLHAGTRDVLQPATSSGNTACIAHGVHARIHHALVHTHTRPLGATVQMLTDSTAPPSRGMQQPTSLSVTAAPRPCCMPPYRRHRS